MDKAGFDKGLIRYASENNIAEGEQFKFTPRIISYTIVLGVLITVLVTLLFSRNDVEATILRLPGQMYSTKGDTIQNVYSIKMINKTNNIYENLYVKLLSHEGSIQMIGGKINLPKIGLDEKTLFVNINKKDLTKSKEKIEIGVFQNGEMIESSTTNFPAPIKIN